MPGTTSTALPSLSHDQHHKTDAAKRKGGVFILDVSGTNMREIVVTFEAIGRAKFQSNCNHQQANTQLLTGRMPFLSPNQQCHSTEARYGIHSSATEMHTANLQNCPFFCFLNKPIRHYLQRSKCSEETCYFFGFRGHIIRRLGCNGG